MNKIVSMLMLMGCVTVVAMANPGAPAPEIDPGSALTALVLFSSVSLVIRGRKKKA